MKRNILLMLVKLLLTSDDICRFSTETTVSIKLNFRDYMTMTKINDHDHCQNKMNNETIGDKELMHVIRK